jgi:hypothetical protein
MLLPLSYAERGIVPVPIKYHKGEQVGLYRESHALISGVSEYANDYYNPLDETIE